MGLFQSVKDAFFITKCIEQVNHVSPAGASMALDFCNENKHFFLLFRNQGYEFDMAVNRACLYMTENPDSLLRFHEDLAISSRSLVIASNYCLHFITRWPDSGLTPAFSEALTKFLEFTKNDPIGRDLGMLTAKR